MATLVYRCPTTGRSVQGWFADGVSENAGETYEAVMCTACSRVHLVSPKTGKALVAGEYFQRSQRRDKN